MPIGFRCTGCRARLHVPKRWSGNTLACPKCGTRVVVPAGGGAVAESSFEGRSVERSLAALDVVAAGSAGGVFAEESFEIPAENRPQAGEKVGGRRSAEGRLTLSRAAFYAYLAAVPLVAIGSFLAGCWWTARHGR